MVGSIFGNGNMDKRLARGGSVLNGERILSPGRSISSGDCAGGKVLPPNRSPAQPPEPLKAPGVEGSVDRPGGEVSSPRSVSEHGTSQLTGSRPGRIKPKKSSGAGATAKKGRQAKRYVVTEAVPPPDSAGSGPPSHGSVEPVGTPVKGRRYKRDQFPPAVPVPAVGPRAVGRHGSVGSDLPVPVALDTVPRDGLLRGRTTQAQPSTVMPVVQRVAPAISPGGTRGGAVPWSAPVGGHGASGPGALSPGGTRDVPVLFPVSGDGHGALGSGPQAPPGLLMEPQRGHKKAKKGKKHRRRSSSSSSSSSDDVRRGKRHHGRDSASSVVSSAQFMQAFQSISASLSALASDRHARPSSSASVAHVPAPQLYQGQFGETHDRRGVPCTLSRAPDSPPALSIHPASVFSEMDAQSGPAPPAPRPTGPATQGAPGTPLEDPYASQSANSAEDEAEVAQLQRLTIAETELRLVQRDMVRVLQLPQPEEPTAPERKSFKRRTGASETSRPPAFPELPLDQVCVDRMNAVATSSSWTPYRRREIDYYRFPREDYDKFFVSPAMPDSAKDKLAADGGATAAKAIFSDRSRGKLESVLTKVDSASRFGMRASSFLLLLTEYLATGCEEDTPVPADLLKAAFHCLDRGLCTVLEQFARVSTLATSSRRSNVLDALFLPSEGARKRLDALPLVGNDLFAGKFQESMEAEAKRLEATDKINLKKPSAPAAKTAPKPKGKASFRIPRRQPVKAARGAFRGRGGARSVPRPTQTQPLAARQYPQGGRGTQASAPRYPGACRK